MQAPRALDAFELGFDARDAFLDDSPVGLELGLARAAQTAESAALALEMGPRAHHPAFLIAQMRVLDLQRSFARMGALPENFQDQPGAVEHLGVPGLLEVALLHRRDGAIHDDEIDLEGLGDPGDLVDLALAQVGRGPDVGDRDQPGLDHLEIDRAGKPDGFVEPRRGRTLTRLRAPPTPAGGPPAQIRTENHRAPAARACGPDQAVAARAPTRVPSRLFPRPRRPPARLDPPARV